MARTFTQHAEDMDDVQNLPDGTAMYFQVRNPITDVQQYDRWVAFDADNAQWRIDNPGEADPVEVPAAAVADPDNIAIGEKLFVQSRFMAKTSGQSGTHQIPAQWAQLNSTNFPTLDVPTTRQALVNIYTAQRVFEDLVPVP